MPADPRQTSIYYKRARFTTRLPVSHKYSPSHYWLDEDAPGLYRIGLTKFATRMLGDFVELHFDVADEERLEIGQSIGTIEGFKAVSEIYSPITGRFAGRNQSLDTDPVLLERDPYGAGWLFRVKDGRIDSALDVEGYVGLLDATIDRMLMEQQKSKDQQC
jgi:glycine cleavage system H protein